MINLYIFIFSKVIKFKLFLSYNLIFKNCYNTKNVNFKKSSQYQSLFSCKLWSTIKFGDFIVGGHMVK